MKFETLLEQTGAFEQKLMAALEELGIVEQCKGLPIDHICVRLKSEVDVANLKDDLEKAGQIISAVSVNGREIMIIQLNQPLNLGSWQTYGIELPYPKPKHDYEDGWEHVEFVLNNAGNTMDGVRSAFVQTFPALDIEQLQSQYEYSEDVPQSDEDQVSNPTIGLKVNGMGLKFHANPIQAVVGFEQIVQTVSG